jgi:hypothetical protein
MNRKRKRKDAPSRLTLAVGRAAKNARKTARDHATPIYIWKDGKVVADKPQCRTRGEFSLARENCDESAPRER